MAGPTYRPSRGFTLVEMLVVVALIALIISILLPTLGRVRENTRRTVCGTRLNQIGAAIGSYRVDWSRSFGLMEYTNNAIVDVNDNMFALASRVPSLESFVCPSTKNFLSSAASLRIRPTSTTGDFSSYESYGHFDVPFVNKTPINCKGKESRVWLVYDMDNPDINHHLNKHDPHGPDGGNVLYADLRVRWVDGSIWEPSRAAAQVR